jgi:carbamoyl-phosphate synthase large subunit
MGFGASLGEALWKAYRGAGIVLPASGMAFLSVHDRDKPELTPVARELAGLGFGLIATNGTAEFLRRQGLAVQKVFKVNEGRPHVVDRLLSGEIHLVINTPLGAPSFYDERAIRLTSLARRIPLITALPAAAAAVEAVRALRAGDDSYRPLQEIHARATD